MCSFSGLEAESSLYPDLYTLICCSTYVPRFLHDSHLVFLSLLPVLVRVLQGQLSSRLQAVGAALLVLGMLKLGQIAGGRPKVTSVPTLLGELISRCTETLIISSLGRLAC